VCLAGSKLDLRSQASGGSLQRRSSGYDHHHHSDHIPAATESQALKEAQNKYRLLEADYKTLHDKRLQDVSVSTPTLNESNQTGV